MNTYYILDNKRATPVADVMTWGRWLETADRKVARDEIGDVSVSTVFLGLDHNLGEGRPHLFETMIFGGEHDQFQVRCTTWDEAEEQHARAVRMVKE